MDGVPPRDQQSLGRDLIQRYHIEAEQLTNCSICHR